MTNLRTLLALVLASALHAQASAPSASQSPFRFIPKDATLVVQSDGLGKWPDRFAGTGLGKLAENELFRLLLAPLGDAQAQLRQRVEAELHYDLGPALQQLRGYGGRATLFLWCPFRDAFEKLGSDAIGSDKTPTAWGLVLEPDGKTDLAKLAAACRELRKAAGDQLTDRSVEAGGRKWSGFTRGESGGTVLLPELDQGQLVMFAVTDPAHLGKLLTLPKEQRMVPDPTSAAAGIWGRFTLTPALTAFAEWIKKGDAPGVTPMSYTIFDKLGFTSLDAFEVRAEPSGKHVRLEASVTFRGAPAGIFAALFPEPGAALTIHELVPPGQTAFSAGGIRWSRLYEAIATLLDDHGGMLGLSREELEQRFEQETGVKLKEDLLDSLGAEHLLVGTGIGQLVLSALAPAAPFVFTVFDEEPGTDSRESSGEGFGFVYALRLANGKSFGDAIEKMVRKAGLHAARKTAEHAGIKVHQLPLIASLPMHYAIADDLALLALGKKGKEQLHGVLDQRAARAEKKPRPPFGAPIEKRLAQLPTSFQGLQVVDLRQLLEASGTPAIAALRQSLGKSEAECTKLWNELRSALKALDLEHVVTTEHVIPGKATYIVLW